jgi:hypothetical protein
MDEAWLDKALGFLRQARLEDAWGAYFLEMIVEDYRELLGQEGKA